MALFRRRNQDEIDLDSRSPQLGLEYEDLPVLEHLVKAGADVTEPRHVLHHLCFPDRERADVSVREPSPQYPEQWTVVCERHDVVLELEVVRDTTDYFETLDGSHDGTYDGWEASV